MHLIAERVASDPTSRDRVKAAYARAAVLKASARASPAAKKGGAAAGKRGRGRGAAGRGRGGRGGRAGDGSGDKYRSYGDFAVSVSSVRPHQVLAINRGEAEKKLSVKVVLRDGDRGNPHTPLPSHTHLPNSPLLPGFPGCPLAPDEAASVALFPPSTLSLTPSWCSPVVPGDRIGVGSKGPSHAEGACPRGRNRRLHPAPPAEAIAGTMRCR